MKKLLITLSIILLTTTAHATEWYVRPDGGTPDVCNGQSDAPYPPSNVENDKNCAFNHIAYILPVHTVDTMRLQENDKVYITGGYIMGLESPNNNHTGDCYSAWAYGCTHYPIPDGVDIIGNNAKLIGTERLSHVLNLSGSDNVNISGVEITDNDTCIYASKENDHVCKRKPFPVGGQADYGIYAVNSQNVTLDNVNIHGLSLGGIRAGDINWVIKNSTIRGNGFVGFEGDIGREVNNQIVVENSIVEYNGCGEMLDGTIHNCTSQGEGGYGDGIALGQGHNGITITNSTIQKNVSDGIDNLYSNSGQITIQNTFIGKNGGNQLKSSTDTYVYNTEIDGECDYFNGREEAFEPFGNCRAGGNTLAIKLHPDQEVELKDVSISGNGDVLVEITGNDCTGATFTYENITMNPGTSFHGGDATHPYWIKKTCTGFSYSEGEITEPEPEPEPTNEVGKSEFCRNFTDYIKDVTITYYGTPVLECKPTE